MHCKLKVVVRITKGMGEKKTEMGPDHDQLLKSS